MPISTFPTLFTVFIFRKILLVFLIFSRQCQEALLQDEGCVRTPFYISCMRIPFHSINTNNLCLYMYNPKLNTLHIRYTSIITMSKLPKSTTEQSAASACCPDTKPTGLKLHNSSLFLCDGIPTWNLGSTTPNSPGEGGAEWPSHPAQRIATASIIRVISLET